jgi:hypothetical protein
MLDAMLRRLVEGAETFPRGKRLLDDGLVRRRHFDRILIVLPTR